MNLTKSIPSKVFTEKYVRAEVKKYLKPLNRSFKHEEILYENGNVKVLFRNPKLMKPYLSFGKEIAIQSNDLIQCYLYVRPPIDCLTPVMLIDKKPIMSITPLEVESQFIPISLARGKVLILGLGLGYYLQRIQHKSKVKEITVIESNKAVIDFYEKTFKLPKNVNIIHDDARQIADYRVDFCYNDIYPTALMFKEMFIDYININIRNNIDTYFAWTQEAILYGLFLEEYNNGHLFTVLFSLDYMKPFKRWLSLGYPFLKTYSDFMLKTRGKEDYFFDAVRISHEEIPEFMRNIPENIWRNIDRSNA